MTKKKKAAILQRFQDTYGILKPALHYASDFELLVAVVLSAQCTDERVNIVTAGLFPEYNSPEKMLQLGLQGLEEKIRTCGLYHSKAKNLMATCAVLCENYKGEVVNHDVAKFVPETDYVVKVIDRHVEKAKHNLKGAPIVIAGGYGMGSKEGFDKLFELAKELHAEVGASRAAVDAGYADHDRQIGQTGVTVRPKLYIACGISGQIQHIAGMQDAGIIISVNSDPNAPINTIADYVINGTVEEVVPKLIKYYKKNSK